MFGKSFLRELILFFISVGTLLVIALLIGSLGFALVALDRNPVEATGTVMGIVMIVFAAIVFFLGATAISCISFGLGFIPWKWNELRTSSPEKFFFAKALAYEIVMFTAIAVIFIPILIFARDFCVGKWAQGVEFVVFAIVMLPLPACAVSSIISAAKAKRYVLFAFTVLGAVIMGALCFGMIVFEVQLFVASASTNMQGLWVTILVLLAICAVYDIVAFVIITTTLKKRGTCIHENHHSDPIS